MNPRPVKVTCADNFKLEITFKNAEIKLFDVTPFLQYPVYQPLNDVAFFCKAKIEHGTVTWDNSIDFDPDRLYLEAVTL